MIPYSRDPEKTIPPSSVKIVGLGGAGANMLERIALDGMEGTELLALNTDIRTLDACIAKDKIQLGANLTKGLGAGGDPDLGQKAVLEAETEIREALKGRSIVFICAGLGGGTGSGAAPIVTRIAREEGAFVVVFATIPFAFEGQRRRDQAETALNELAVLSNALVTFDNNRMGELVLAKQGIHEAFVAADNMISESIKAVIRLVVRPGLINIGLDELVSALRTNRSRCLFGSGIAEGSDRASKALRSALASPLLDQGSLLKEAQTVLIHLCGGEDLTLFEVELLMQSLHKHVPDSAQILFGAAIDPSMGNSLSLTLISALPEESLAMAPRDAISQAESTSPLLEKPTPKPEPAPAPKPVPVLTPEPKPELKPTATEPPPAPPLEEEPAAKVDEPKEEPKTDTPSLFDEDRPFAEPDEDKEVESPFTIEDPSEKEPEETPDDEPKQEESKPERDKASDIDLDDDDFPPSSNKTPAIPEKRPEGAAPWSPKTPSEPDTSKGNDDEADEIDENKDEPDEPIAEEPKIDPIPEQPEEQERQTARDPSIPKLKLGVKKSESSDDELSLDSTPRGRFEGENPNVFEGEDLDLPPFLRKKK